MFNAKYRSLKRDEPRPRGDLRYTTLGLLVLMVLGAVVVGIGLSVGLLRGFGLVR